MGKRVEWLKFVMQYSRPRSRQLLLFLRFEAYYQLCTLRGYRPHHFLDPMPVELKGLRPGDRYIVTWTHLPLSISLLSRIFSEAGHVEFEPYTLEAVEDAKAKGRRVEVGVV